MAIVAQLVAAWDGSSRAQLTPAWVENAPGLSITIDGDFERSCVDPALSSWDADFGDGQPIIRIQARRQTCIAPTGTWENRWLEPVARISGVNGVRPWVTFRPYQSTNGDDRNMQIWQSTQRAHYSYDGVNWQPFLSPWLSASELRFRASAAFTQDVVYVARSWPRSVTQIGNQIAAIAASHPDKIAPAPTAAAFVPSLTTTYPAEAYIAGELSARTNELGAAVPAAPLYAFELNDSAYSGPKKLGFITAGVHAGEDVGEVVLWEMVDFFLSSTDPAAQYARENLRILVYPCVNPSGRVAGYWRGAPGSDIDTNREWNSYLTPTPTHDLVPLVKSTVSADVGSDRVWWTMDVHASPIGGRAQPGIRTSHPGTVAWDGYARSRYPLGDWNDYDDRNTVGLVDGHTIRAWMGREFSAVCPLLFETCDRPGPITPAVMRPYAEASIGALADMDAAGWFDVAPTGTLTAQESGADTAAIAGAVLVSGALSVTEYGADTAIIIGGNILAGYLAAQEAGSDTAAASGAVVVSGTMAASEAGADGFAASGSIGSSDIIGNVAALESGSDSIVVAGAVIVSGSMAAAESGSDTMQTDNGEWYPSSRTISVPSGRTITLRPR